MRVEFPEQDHPAHIKLIENHLAQWSEMNRIARGADMRNPDELVEQLRIVVSGDVMITYLDQSDFVPESFYKASKTLIAEHMQ